MFIDNENYELINDIEIDSLLADLPFGLLKENIKEQVNNPLSTQVDYLNIILERCEISKKEMEDNESFVNDINNALIDFLNFVIHEIDSKFNLDIDYEEMSDELATLINICTTLYTFFILNYKKNISRFIYKFITKNKKSLVEQFEKVGKKKDVTSMSLKKQLKNKDDVLIISNLPQVIKYIINLYMDASDFMKFAANDSSYEGNHIKNLISDNVINGNFVSSYTYLLVDKYNDILDEIQTEVKFKLLKK